MNNQGYSFFPNPTAVEEFKSKVRGKYGVGENSVLLEDILDYFANEFKAILSKEPNKKAYLENKLKELSDLDVWNDEILDKCKNYQDFEKLVESIIEENKVEENKVKVIREINLEAVSIDGVSLNLFLQHRNTFKFKEEIKKLGGKWNGKAWIMPDEKAYQKAMELCES